MYIFTQKKSFPFSVFFAIFCVSSCFAVPKEVVRLSETVNVKSGKVQVTSIVADETEMIYIELPKNLYVVRALDKSKFAGEILPPLIISPPASNPRTRMKNLITFELYPSTGEKLKFIPRANYIKNKSLLSLIYNKDETITRNENAKLIFIYKNKNIQMPKLWEFISENKGWIRRGGKTDQDGENSIFSVILRGSGIFSILDEQPIPEQFAEDFIIQTKNTPVDENTLEENLLITDKSSILDDDRSQNFSNEDFSNEDFLNENQELIILEGEKNLDEQKLEKSFTPASSANENTLSSKDLPENNTRNINPLPSQGINKVTKNTNFQTQNNLNNNPQPLANKFNTNSSKEAILPASGAPEQNSSLFQKIIIWFIPTFLLSFLLANILFFFARKKSSR